MPMVADETGQYFEDPALWDRGPEPYQVQMQGDLARLVPPDTAVVLDAACGNGLVSKQVAAKVRVVGADGSFAALRHFAGERCQCRLEAIPFADRAFDLVMANDVLEHLAAADLPRVRDELFRVAGRHVLITVPLLEDLAASAEVCAACGFTAHRNRHERRFDVADLAALTPPGWRLALAVLSGAEWDRGCAELTMLRRSSGATEPGPRRCSQCGAAGDPSAAGPAMHEATALAASVDVRTGSFTSCRTEIIGCFHREGAPNPWAETARSTARVARVVDPHAVDLTATGVSLFRSDFLPTESTRGYYCASARAGKDGIELAADGPDHEIKIGHFARAAGPWILEGVAAAAALRLQFHHADGYRFVEILEVDGVFRHECAVGPPFGPFGRLAAITVVAGRVRLVACTHHGHAIAQEFVDAEGAPLLALPVDGVPIAVATPWYGDAVPHPRAVAAGLHRRREQLAWQEEVARNGDRVDRLGACVDALAQRMVAGASSATEAQVLEARARDAEQNARRAAADCTRLAARVADLEAEAAAAARAAADAAERLRRLRHAEFAVNSLRLGWQRLRAILPKGPRTAPAQAPAWEPRTAVMLVPDDRIDRRVLLQARSLVAAGWRVRVVGAPAPTPGDRHDEDAFPEVEIVRVDASRACVLPADRLPPRIPAGERDWTDFYWLTNHYYALATERPFQVVVAHDLPVLPAAAMAAARHGAWLCYDAHELYPEQHHFGAERQERYRRAEAQLAPVADFVVTVNESIAAEMAQRYGIAMPSVVLNCPEVPSTLPKPRRGELHTACGIPANTRILLFLGALSLNRNLEALVAAMASVRTPDVVLVLVGPGDDKRRELEGIARGSGVLGTRVFFHPPVPQADVLRLTGAADAGVIPYPHIDLNSRLCTPNKLFDLLVAGVPILANDSPELRRFVPEQGVGMAWPFTDAAAIAAGIDAFFAHDHAAYRRQLAAIGARFTWQNEGVKVVAAYEKLIAAGAPRAAGSN
jgi:glycosyltransferase involved in cell wall biosynthesis/SAM-dependent methyltransferase